MNSTAYQVLAAGNQPCRASSNLCPPMFTYPNTTLGECLSCPVGCAKCDSNGVCTEECDSTCADCAITPANCIACAPGELLVFEVG